MGSFETHKEARVCAICVIGLFVHIKEHVWTIGTYAVKVFLN